ncbi:2-hydroxyacid dehydrogenase [Rhodopseudomonas sp. BAL398]|nr:2-hydroxyacid dehydrogenase [Rhodopseudomonas sp. BAL398]
MLVLVELLPENLARFQAAGFHVDLALTPAERAARMSEAGNNIRAVLTNGSTGLRAEEIARLPRLEIVCALGAGYENIDLVAAGARGIVVTNGAGTNDASVADHAMALLLSVVRGIPNADATLRRGGWKEIRTPRPLLFGKKLGVLGLGNIGDQIARRAHRGFEMQVAYHNRKPRNDVDYLYRPSPAALAAWCDYLIIATPGGPATRHLVDAAVLTAVGPDGFLVNIARGSVVDTVALIDALRQHRIAGAALDVVEGEPVVPEGLLSLGHVVLTPHIAGRSPEAVAATTTLAIENLAAHFAGRPVLTPVEPA